MFICEIEKGYLFLSKIGQNIELEGKMCRLDKNDCNYLLQQDRDLGLSQELGKCFSGTICKMKFKIVSFVHIFIVNGMFFIVKNWPFISNLFSINQTELFILIIRDYISGTKNVHLKIVYHSLVENCLLYYSRNG